MKIKDLKKEEISEISNILGGTFYQCWAEYNPGGMLQAIEKAFHYDPAKDDAIVWNDNLVYLEGLKALFLALEAGENILDIIKWMPSDFSPERHNLSKIEWLVLLKQYIAGNYSVFDHISSIMEPYNKWKATQDIPET